VGNVAERDDDLRVDELQLTRQVGGTGRDLSRGRRPVVRWPAPHHRGAPDRGGVDADVQQRLVQDVARAARQGVPVDVLVTPRDIADDHQTGIARAVPDDRLPALLVERAGRTALHRTLVAAG
jgi:hypothetical protein